MNASLIAAITSKEVQKATFQLGKTQALGPDGLNGLFYQTHWNILQEELVLSVQNFFQTGVMLVDLNKTIVSLIPKVPNPESLDQYRPISLCNYAYKIISKVLANGLKPSYLT